MILLLQLQVFPPSGGSVVYPAPREVVQLSKMLPTRLTMPDTFRRLFVSGQVLCDINITFPELDTALRALDPPYSLRHVRTHGMGMHFTSVKPMPAVKTLASAGGYEALKFAGCQNFRVMATPFADQLSLVPGGT